MSFSLQDIAKEDIGFTAGAETVITADDIPRNILDDSIHSPVSLVTVLEDKAKEKEEATKKVEPVIVADKTPVSLETIADTILETEEEKVEQSAAGRPKTDKNALISYLKTKVESNEFSVYDDYDEKVPLDQYLSGLPEKELYELLDSNIQKAANIGYEKAPLELREALPPKMQYAIDYIAAGGTNLEELFTSLAKTVQIEKLNPEKEQDQQKIVRSYLQVTTKLTADQIDEQVDEWADAGKIEKKAKEFKPTLDEMHEQQVQYQIQQEANATKQRQEAAYAYAQKVGAVLSKGEIGGMKINKTEANDLYYDLVETNYQSVSGKPTNLIGHILEKIQMVEPDFNKVAKLALFMKDMDAYDARVKQLGANDKVVETVKKLKDAQYIKAEMTTPEVKEPQVKKMTKPRNILERA